MAATTPRAPPYSWLPPRKLDEQDVIHPGAMAYKTGQRTNHFHISPEWTSEDMHARTVGGLRRYRPWAFEFQGARYYPWGSREQRWTEEKLARELLEADPNPAERYPAQMFPMKEEEFDAERAKYELYIQDNRAPWARPPGIAGTGTSAQGLYNTYPLYSSANPLPPIGRRKSFESTPFVLNPDHFIDTAGIQSAREREVASYTANYQKPDDRFNPIVYRGPEDEEHRRRSQMISKFKTFEPHSGRPRFDRPFFNSVNSLWMRYPPDAITSN